MLLSLHPHTPAEGRIDVRISRTDAGALTLEYGLTLADLCLPEPALRVHTDGLWRRTCCEAFIASRDAAGGGTGYREFNFSPSGAFAGYIFQGYRAGQETLELPDPDIRLEQFGAAWFLRADIAAAALPAGPLRIGLCGVLEDAAGRISYWALRHPPGKPDFHHPDCFALELA